MPNTQSLKQYNQWIMQHPDAPERIEQVIVEALDDAGVSYDQVSIRIKDRQSYAAKLDNPDYPNYVSFDTAYDIIGARITTYHRSEIPEIKAVIENLFDVEREIDKSAQTREKSAFGYSSLHIIARIPDTIPELEDLTGQIIEVQLRTVLQHAWAEFEHDIRYKNPQQTLNPDIQRAFTLSAGLVELADQEFDSIVSTLSENGGMSKRDEDTEPLSNTELTAQTLPGVLTMLAGPAYPMSRAQYYSWGLDMMAANGVTTIGELQKIITPENLQSLNDAMGYGYKPGQVRLLDDLLLREFGRDHIHRTVHIGNSTSTRSGRLGSRWQKLQDAASKSAEGAQS